MQSSIPFFNFLSSFAWAVCYARTLKHFNSQIAKIIFFYLYLLFFFLHPTQHPLYKQIDTHEHNGNQK